MMNNGQRKLPRIMKKSMPKKDPKDFNNQDDEAQKLRNEGFEVHSGVLTINSNHPSHFQPKVLPGTANDVESYPCPFCRDRLFLTGSGLEKHGREQHPGNMGEIVGRITSISTEWKKREFEQMRAKERLSMDRLRHEARAAEMVRAAMNNGGPNDNDMSGDRFEACAICNVLINASHPTAMESHQRAHKKNDELRLQLLEAYGPDIVQRLTCESCSLVFTEDRKLQLHIASHHVRKKRYICKFCGQILPSLTELNLHKSDVHNLVLHNRTVMKADEWNVVPDRYLPAGVRRSGGIYRRDLEVARRGTKRGAGDMSNVEDPSTSSVKLGEVSEGDVPCRIHCPECTLILGRPVLLIKHMRRVHSKIMFSCLVESGGLPTFGIDFEESGMFWTCCSMKFDNRAEFIEHRRMHIPHNMRMRMLDEASTSNAAMSIAADMDEIEDEPDYEGRLVHGPDGTVQVIIPEGVDMNGPVYVVFDQQYEGEKSNKVRLVHANSMIDTDELIEEGDDGNGEEHQLLQNEDNQEVITVTQDQFDQLQMQMGNDWSHVGVMLVDEDDVLEDENVQEVVIGDDDGNSVIIGENDRNVSAEINGTPLFD